MVVYGLACSRHYYSNLIRGGQNRLTEVGKASTFTKSPTLMRLYRGRRSAHLRKSMFSQADTMLTCENESGKTKVKTNLWTSSPSPSMGPSSPSMHHRHCSAPLAGSIAPLAGSTGPLTGSIAPLTGSVLRQRKGATCRPAEGLRAIAVGPQAVPEKGGRRRPSQTA